MLGQICFDLISKPLNRIKYMHYTHRGIQIFKFHIIELTFENFKLQSFERL